MLNYKLMIGEKIFPNRLMSFAERCTKYTPSGNMLQTFPTLTLQLEDHPDVSNLEIIKAIQETPTFTIIDPDKNNQVISTFTDYTAFGSCDRMLEEDGFKILVSMYTPDIEQNYQNRVESGELTPITTGV